MYISSSLSSSACVIVVVCLSEVILSTLSTRNNPGLPRTWIRHSSCDTLTIHQIPLEALTDFAYLLDGHQGRVWVYINLPSLARHHKSNLQNPPHTSTTTTHHFAWNIHAGNCHQPTRPGYPEPTNPLKQERYIARAVTPRRPAGKGNKTSAKSRGYLPKPGAHQETNKAFK